MQQWMATAEKFPYFILSIHSVSIKVFCFFYSMDTSLTTRHTFWSVQILGLYFIISVIGVNQAQFQRLSSVRTLQSSQG